jgi:hypothetical protein
MGKRHSEVSLGRYTAVRSRLEIGTGSLLFIFRSLSFKWLYAPECMRTSCLLNYRGNCAGAES